MTETWFLDQLEDLTGKVAIVTGGAAGIGLENTIYLAAKGCKVYVASRNQEKCEKGIKEAETRLAGKGGQILFHQLDLGHIAKANESAKEFLPKEERLDIIVANAGVSMTAHDTLSDDGWEKSFATNHLGHAAFILGLLDRIKETAQKHDEARIVMVSSNATKAAKGFDYEYLQKPIPNDGQRMKDAGGAFQRYGVSKLANAYFSKQLDKKIQESGVSNVFVNALHPGMSAATGLGSNQMNPFPPGFEKVIRGTMNVFSSSNADCAKTQTFLAASKEVKEKKIHGQFWSLNINFRAKYKDCGQDASLEAVVKDDATAQKLWDETEKIINEATAKATAS